LSKKSRIRKKAYTRPENAYAFLGLKKNPFHPSSHPPENVKIIADYSEIYYKIQEKLNWVVSRDYNEKIIIFGSYGQGKSHILRATYNIIKDEDVKSVLFYTHLPIDLRFRTLYNKLLVENLDQSKIKDIFQNGKPTSLSGPLGADVLTALNCILDDKKSDTAWKWLRGSPTYSHERNDIDVSIKLDRNDEYCVSALLALVEAFVLAGVDIIYFGIDEVETAKTSTPSDARKTEQLLSLFRRLIDGFKSKTLFMLASTSEWGIVWTGFGALYSRFPESDTIVIPYVEKIETMKVFVFDFLYPSRDDSNITEIRKKLKLDDFSLTEKDLLESKVRREDIEDLKKDTKLLEIGVYPFSRKSLESLLEISEKLPRNIVKSCHLLIEKLVELKKSDPEKIYYINDKFLSDHKDELLEVMYKPEV